MTDFKDSSIETDFIGFSFTERINQSLHKCLSSTRRLVSFDFVGGLSGSDQRARQDFSIFSLWV